MNKAEELELICRNCKKPVVTHDGIEAQDCLVFYIKKMLEFEIRLQEFIKELEVQGERITRIENRMNKL